MKGPFREKMSVMGEIAADGPQMAMNGSGWMELDRHLGQIKGSREP